MKPLKKMSIKERQGLIIRFLKEMYFDRRKDVFKWAKITHQTPLITTKFLGQNLVSLITGVPGVGTAARGSDLADGSEIKSCSRVDQLSRCGKCGVVVTAFENACPKCGNTKISRKTDSHWIFTINTEEKRQFYIKARKIYLLLIDNEADTKGNNVLARFRVWLLQPEKDKLWRGYVEEYYNIYYLKKLKEGKKPAPMNLHPLMPKTNRLGLNMVFDAIVTNDGNVKIAYFEDIKKIETEKVKEPIKGQTLSLENFRENISKGIYV